MLQAGAGMRMDDPDEFAGFQGVPKAVPVSSESTDEARVVVTSQSSSTRVATILKPAGDAIAGKKIKKEPGTETDSDADP